MLMKTNFTVIEYSTSTLDLSGITFRDASQEQFELPVDPDSTIHDPQDEGKSHDLPERISLQCNCQLTSPCGDRTINDPPHCYKVHSHCCNWIRRIIRPTAEDHLNLLLAALRYRWEEFPYESDELVGSAEEGHYNWM